MWPSSAQKDMDMDKRFHVPIEATLAAILKYKTL